MKIYTQKTAGARMYKWTITVSKYNTYGDRIVSTYDTVIYAADKDAMITKMRVAFNVQYDNFRNFFTHSVTTIHKVEEVLSV